VARLVGVSCDFSVRLPAGARERCTRSTTWISRRTRKDARARRRERLGQIDPGPPAAAPDPPHIRTGRARRRRHHPREGGPSADAAPKDAAGLPGPVLLLRSTGQHRVQRGRGADLFTPTSDAPTVSGVRPNCSTRFVSRRLSHGAGPGRCLAVSCSGRPSPAPWPPNPNFWPSTSRSAHWTSPPRCRSSTCWATCRTGWASPTCSFPMTSTSFTSLSHRVAVMYLGRIVEEGPVDDLFSSAHHPYTQALLSASPSIDPATATADRHWRGDIPSPMNPPSGCHFRTRCRHAMDVCAEDPAKTEVGPLAVWCHLLDQVVETGTVPSSLSEQASPTGGPHEEQSL
jgi:oligopeptide/dipeptide ABC transporter ATP-binding protein